MNLIFDAQNTQRYAKPSEWEAAKRSAVEARDVLLGRSGPGSEFTGWVDLPVEYDREEFSRIQKAAERIREDSEVLVVAGIGGSYLGARAAIEFLTHSFYNMIPGNLQILFAGNSLSDKYLTDLLNLIGDRDFSVNVISKSGTTTETAVAFRFFKEKLEQKYGRKGAAKRIYATTDREKGTLKKLADQEGYESFVVPDDIGGRYSVLSAVGLLPIAAAGCDIESLMQGAAEMRENCIQGLFDEVPALQYAAARRLMFSKGKLVEILASYEPSCHSLIEWWKQLYGESEGKGGGGLFPAGVDLTTDLHSMGQYIQDGQRILLETVLDIGSTSGSIVMSASADNADGLDYLAGKSLQEINHKAMEGTVQAHEDGGVPCFAVRMPAMDAFSLGELFYFFMFACAVSGYMGKVNPFDQPGVESYKKNMFRLLGKPGYAN